MSFGISESSKSNAPSTSFHVPDSPAGSLLWVPDDKVLQAFRLDSDPALRPSDIIHLAGILVDGIGELLDIDILSLFNFGCGPRLWGCFGLIEVILACEWEDLDIISRGTDVVVEESLELQLIFVGLVCNMNIRAKFAFCEGHDVFEEDREVEDLLHLWCGTKSWRRIRNLNADTEE